MIVGWLMQLPLLDHNRESSFTNCKERLVRMTAAAGGEAQLYELTSNCTDVSVRFNAAACRLEACEQV